MPRAAAFVVTQGPDGQDKEILGVGRDLPAAIILAEQLGSRKPVSWAQTTPCYWWGTGTDLFIVQTQLWD